VATRVGGIPEIVEDGVTGLLVPSKDPRAFAAALARVAGDAGWRRRAAAAARRAAVERGTIDGRARRIETMIEGLVAGLAS
jgi:glycosyltransferase involved in cell wall biosynthesis